MQNLTMKKPDVWSGKPIMYKGSSPNCASNIKQI